MQTIFIATQEIYMWFTELLHHSIRSREGESMYILQSIL